MDRNKLVRVKIEHTSEKGKKSYEIRLILNGSYLSSIENVTYMGAKTSLYPYKWYQVFKKYSDMRKYRLVEYEIRWGKKYNWFYNLSNFWATTLMGIVLTIIGWCATEIASSIKEGRFIELENKHRLLRDSLFRIIPTLPKAQNETDSGANTASNSNVNTPKHDSLKVK